MRSSTLLTLTGAALAVASPVHKHLHKKAIVWDIVTDIAYVTVTEGNLPTTSSEHTSTVVVTHTSHPSVEGKPKSHSSTSKIVPTTSVAPPPAPTTTHAPPPPAPTTTETPSPATTEAPATTQSSAAAPTIEEVKPTTSSAEVVAAPASSVADNSAAAPTDFASTGLFHHNAHRSNHSASAMTWSDELAGYAQQLADTCHYGHDQTIGGGGYGQNIDATGMNSADTVNWDQSKVLANAITNDWYLTEYGNLDFGVASPAEIAGKDWTHFTQMIWKKSTSVGCAVKYCDASFGMLSGTDSWYTVCNYGPTGNVLGEFVEEVSASLGLAPVGGSSGVPSPWLA